MASIVLDCVVEQPLEEFVADMEKSYDLKLTVLKENGPAGGWPEIKFEGRRKRVEAFIRTYCGQDVQDIEFFNEQISE